MNQEICKTGAILRKNFQVISWKGLNGKNRDSPEPFQKTACQDAFTHTPLGKYLTIFLRT
jgi:hypothetical protein